MDVDRTPGLAPRHAQALRKASAVTAADALCLGETNVMHACGASLHAAREVVQLLADSIIPTTATVSARRPAFAAMWSAGGAHEPQRGGTVGDASGRGGWRRPPSASRAPCLAVCGAAGARA